MSAEENICILSPCYDGGFQEAAHQGLLLDSWAWAPREGPHTLFISRQNLTWVYLRRKEHLIRSLSNSLFSPVHCLLLVSLQSLWTSVWPPHPLSCMLYVSSGSLLLIYTDGINYQLCVTTHKSMRPQLLSWLVFTNATFVCFPRAIPQAPLTQHFSSLLPLTQTCISSTVKVMSIYWSCNPGTWKVTPLSVCIQCN